MITDTMPRHGVLTSMFALECMSGDELLDHDILVRTPFSSMVTASTIAILRLRA